MSPRGYVEDALRRLTDGSLTFRIEEDRYSVVAGYNIGHKLVTHSWPKWRLRRTAFPSEARFVAEQGVAELLRKGNRA